LSEGFTSHQIQNKSFQIRSFQPISWLSTEKLNLTQQKQTLICNKICSKFTMQNKHKKQKLKPLMASDLETERAYS